jgi:hypothetical protein
MSLPLYFAMKILEKELLSSPHQIKSYLMIIMTIYPFTVMKILEKELLSSPHHQIKRYLMIIMTIYPLIFVESPRKPLE